MRHRFAGVVLLALFFAPIGGWCKGAIVDPNGRPTQDSADPVEASSLPEVPTLAGDESQPSLEDQVLSWLDAWLRSLRSMDL